MQTPVVFENEGQKLFGMIHMPEGKGPWPGVVFCHGFTGHKIETHCIFVKLAREMCRRGIAVLRFDFRGSGESEGLFEEMTVQGEISDAGKALEFLAGYKGIDPSRIGLLGFSLGGLVASIGVGPDKPGEASGGKLLAIDPASGKTKWEFRADDPIVSSPAVSNGMVYVGTLGGTLYGFSGGSEPGARTTSGTHRTTLRRPRRR